MVETAPGHPDKSPRQPAWYLTDTQGHFISTSSVYRVLKVNDPITSPSYMVLVAGDRFDEPITHINQLWQAYMTYLKIIQCDLGRCLPRSGGSNL